MILLCRRQEQWSAMEDSIQWRIKLNMRLSKKSQYLAYVSYLVNTSSF